MGRNRATQPKPKGLKRRPRSPKDEIMAWRGAVLVGVGGSGIAGLLTAHYARGGDLLTSALFAVALVLLMGLAAYATLRTVALSRAYSSKSAR